GATDRDINTDEGVLGQTSRERRSTYARRREVLEPEPGRHGALRRQLLSPSGLRRCTGEEDDLVTVGVRAAGLGAETPLLVQLTKATVGTATSLAVVAVEKQTPHQVNQWR